MLTYNLYKKEYIIIFKPLGFAFQQTLRYDTLKSALYACENIYNQYGITIKGNF
jgi:hypothetical protein